MLTKFSVKKPFTVLVAVIITLVFGMVSFTRMTPDLFPKFDLPYVVVMTTYPGASSQEVEETVTVPMEQQLASLENLKNVSSTSQKNISLIILEFEQEANLDTVSVDIRDKSELASMGWNEKIQKPVIMKLNPSMIPIAVAAVSQEGKSISETSALLEDELLRKLEGINGVASVSATGLVENTVHVTIDEKKVENINNKISGTISAGFSDAKKQINTQITNAKDGIAKLEAGKSAIRDAQSELYDRGEQFKQVLVSLKTLNVIKSTLPPNTEMYNKAQEAINQIVNQLKPMASQLSALGVDVSKLDTLQGVMETEKNLDKALQSTENQLNNSMAELTGNGALLASANMQLEATLAQIAQQETTAQSSANVSSYLNVSGISGLITAQDFEMPAGYISEDGKDVLVTVGDKMKSIDDLKNMIILDMGIDGIDPVTLADVTNIEYLSIGDDGYSKINGEEGVMLIFSKQSDYSTTEASDNILETFSKLEKEYDGLHFDTLSNQGDYIHMAIDSVLSNLLIGAVLAILILLFFLRDIKPTTITAVSIPISIMFAIALMYFSGVTLNIVSLAGLAVGVGMLVDNSIVVIENIYRLRTMGYSKVKASVSGALQVAGAITASTITTVCVFVPVVFMDGLTKMIFKDMALTVTYSLFASLIVALTIVPTLTSVSLEKVKANTMLNQESKAIAKYRELCEWCLKHKAIVLVSVVALLVGSIGLTLLRGFEFMPAMSTPQISATIEMPEESTKEDTATVGDEILKSVGKIDGVETVGATLSSNMGAMLGMGGGASDFSSLSLYILMDEDKMDNNDKVVKQIEKIAEKHKCEATVTGSTDMMAMMGGSGVSINVEGDDLDDIRTAAIQIEDAMRGVEGLTEVSDIGEQSTDEIKLVIDKEKAMEYGLTVAQVYAQVAEKISTEQTATSINYDGSNKDVVVTSKADEPLSEDQLLALEIKGSGNSASKSVALSQLATVSHNSVIDNISRINQKRGQTVSAQVEEGYNVTLLTDKVEKAVNKLDLPDGVNVEFKGEDEQIMEAMIDMLKMFVLAFLLVYLVMVAQFQSLVLPFIVMFTVPLAVTGAMFGLLVSGLELSVIAMIGIVMLMGIIVNNAIVLIDYINQMRLEGLDKHQAIVDAGAVRMRPVLMTAITTILGLIPMIVGAGQGAEMMQPVAIVCVGGLAYATLMTLFVIPVMYDIFARRNMKKITEDELTIVDA